MANKEKIQLEFVIKSSPNLLYNRISTASGLAEWFADDVSIKEDVYTFTWDGYPQDAQIIHKKMNTSVRYKWIEDENEETYFEFKISQDELTGDVSLIITDFVDPDEKMKQLVCGKLRLGI